MNMFMISHIYRKYGHWEQGLLIPSCILLLFVSAEEASPHLQFNICETDIL